MSTGSIVNIEDDALVPLRSDEDSLVRLAQVSLWKFSEESKPQKQSTTRLFFPIDSWRSLGRHLPSRWCRRGGSDHFHYPTGRQPLYFIDHPASEELLNHAFFWEEKTPSFLQSEELPEAHQERLAPLESQLDFDR